MAYSAPFATMRTNEDPPWYVQEAKWSWTRRFGRSLSDVTLDGPGYYSGFVNYNSINEKPRILQKRLAMRRSGLGGVEVDDTLRECRSPSAGNSSSSSSLANRKATVVAAFRDRERRHAEWNPQQRSQSQAHSSPSATCGAGHPFSAVWDTPSLAWTATRTSRGWAHDLSPL